MEDSWLSNRLLQSVTETNQTEFLLALGHLFRNQTVSYGFRWIQAHGKNVMCIYQRASANLPSCPLGKYIF